MGYVQCARVEKIKHNLDSVLLGQKVRPEPKGVGEPSLRPWELRSTENIKLKKVLLYIEIYNKII